eukprot:UN05954
MIEPESAITFYEFASGTIFSDNNMTLPNYLIPSRSEVYLIPESDINIVHEFHPDFERFPMKTNFTIFHASDAGSIQFHPGQAQSIYDYCTRHGYNYKSLYYPSRPVMRELTFKYTKFDSMAKYREF